MKSCYFMMGKKLDNMNSTKCSSCKKEIYSFEAIYCEASLRPSIGSIDCPDVGQFLQCTILALSNLHSMKICLKNDLNM